MNKRNKNIFFLLPIILIFGNELIRTFIRPKYGKKEFGLISEILGWLPNFLAAFGFLTMGISLIIIAQDVSQKQLTKKQGYLMLIVLVIIGLIGFLGHELTQKGTGLVYDVNDIYATIVGIALGSFLFYWAILKQIG